MLDRATDGVELPDTRLTGFLPLAAEATDLQSSSFVEFDFSSETRLLSV
jgi:hypothetical protein